MSLLDRREHRRHREEERATPEVLCVLHRLCGLESPVLDAMHLCVLAGNGSGSILIRPDGGRAAQFSCPQSSCLFLFVVQIARTPRYTNHAAISITGELRCSAPEISSRGR